MHEQNNNGIMDILYDELYMELRSARISKDSIKKTWNPFKKISFYRTYKMNIQHAHAIEFALRRIRREMGL